MDFQKVEAAILVLQEVTDEHVECALVFRVNIHLREDLVDFINCFDGVGVRVWHALYFDSVLIAITVNCE